MHKSGTLTKAGSDRLRLAVALNGTMTDYNKDALLANPDGITSFLGPAWQVYTQMFRSWYN
jgi:hypothetical protein